MAKLKGGKLVREVADWCVQFHGGTGYMWETRVNRFYRDARLMGIGGGADEVMMAIIAKFEGTLPGKGNR
jgi:citronellyl-CoA dehydrogenase